MVTASDCSPSLVTNKPLMAPHNPPTTNALSTATGMFPECSQTNPNVQLDRAAVDDTERSISPAMIKNVIEHAISMISAMLWMRNVMLLVVRNFSFQKLPMISVSTASTGTNLSHPRRPEDFIVVRRDVRSGHDEASRCGRH